MDVGGAVTKYCDFLVSFLQRIMDNGRFHHGAVCWRRLEVGDDGFA